MQVIEICFLITGPPFLSVWWSSLWLLEERVWFLYLNRYIFHNLIDHIFWGVRGLPSTQEIRVAFANIWSIHVIFLYFTIELKHLISLDLTWSFVIKINLTSLLLPPFFCLCVELSHHPTYRLEQGVSLSGRLRRERWLLQRRGPHELRPRGRSRKEAGEPENEELL